MNLEFVQFLSVLGINKTITKLWLWLTLPTGFLLMADGTVRFCTESDDYSNQHLPSTFLCSIGGTILASIIPLARTRHYPLMYTVAVAIISGAS